MVEGGRRWRAESASDTVPLWELPDKRGSNPGRAAKAAGCEEARLKAQDQAGVPFSRTGAEFLQNKGMLLRITSYHLRQVCGAGTAGGVHATPSNSHVRQSAWSLPVRRDSNRAELSLAN